MALLDILGQIKELYDELQTLLPMATEQQAALDKKFRLEFNYNSNHIEGNTLTYAETELLLIFDETRGTHPHRDYEEMKASDVALEMIEQLSKDETHPLTESFIKNLNEILLVRPYWKEAITPDGGNTRRKILIGDYKKQPNSVLLSNGETFDYASPAETPELMADLIEWVRTEEEKNLLHPVEIAALIHYKFVRIHPFDDGNGRVSRLLMNYILLKNGYPSIVIKTNDKRNYLAALHDADTGNIDSFKEYIAKQLVWSLELSLNAARNESLEEAEDWKKELSIVKKQLADKETISIVKSTNSLMDLINNQIIPFSIMVKDSLTEFDGLFLQRKLNYFSKQSNTFKNLTSSLKFEREAIDKFFGGGYEIQFFFEDFTKDPDNPFNVIVGMAFNFEKHKYQIRLDGNILFTKLYHQQFSDRELEETKNRIGNIVVSNIKEKVI